jgi:hypothetical protein
VAASCPGDLLVGAVLPAAAAAGKGPSDPVVLRSDLRAAWSGWRSSVAGHGCGDCGRRRRGGRAPTALVVALAGAEPSTLAVGACLRRGQVLGGWCPWGGGCACRWRWLLVASGQALDLVLRGRQRQGLAHRHPTPSSVVVVLPWWWSRGAARCLLWRYGGAWVAQGLPVAVVRRRWDAGHYHVH